MNSALNYWGVKLLDELLSLLPSPPGVLRTSSHQGLILESGCSKSKLPFVLKAQLHSWAFVLRDTHGKLALQLHQKPAKKRQLLFKCTRSQRMVTKCIALVGVWGTYDPYLWHVLLIAFADAELAKLHESFVQTKLCKRLCTRETPSTNMHHTSHIRSQVSTLHNLRLHILCDLILPCATGPSPRECPSKLSRKFKKMTDCRATVMWE